jgi:hypothetical protein
MDQEKKSGISIQTLAISAVAAVAAAVVVPMIWERGTLIATAMTPVIVALTSEALRKPAEKITAVTPRVARRSATGASLRRPEAFDPLPPEERTHAPAVSEGDPFDLYGRTPVVRHHWKLAAATGLVAFAIAAVFLTGSELLFGGPATRESGRTTLFGGSEATPTATPTVTPSATGTPTPEATETPPPEATATPTVTPTPTPQLGVAPTPTPTP